MLELIRVTSDAQNLEIRRLFLEYIQWMIAKFNQEYGLTFDEDQVLDEFLAGACVFYPPQGSMYLAKVNQEFVGIGCLKELGEGIGEIKRMFVSDAYRGRGIGKAILDQLIADARSKGYLKIRLDSPKVSITSHGLYQSRGFCYIELYAGSEAAESIPDLAVYMELVL